MRRLHPTVLGLTAVLTLAGCTGGGGATSSPSPTSAETSAPAPTSTLPSATPTASASPSPSTTLRTLPAADCLRGTYSLVRFVAASNQTYGTGEGGDVTVAFSGDRYTLSGAGKKPVQITLGGNTGQLSVDGTAQGTSSLDGTTATFKAQKTSGSGTVRLGEGSQRLTMTQVTSVIGLEGEGEVACTAQAMTLTFPTVRLELAHT